MKGHSDLISNPTQQQVDDLRASSRIRAYVKSLTKNPLTNKTKSEGQTPVK